MRTSHDHRKRDKCLFLLAEGVGFEPTDGCPSAVFKTAAIDLSATLPTTVFKTGAIDHSATLPRMMRPGRSGPGARILAWIEGGRRDPTFRRYCPARAVVGRWRNVSNDARHSITLSKQTRANNRWQLLLSSTLCRCSSGLSASLYFGDAHLSRAAITCANEISPARAPSAAAAALLCTAPRPAVIDCD